MSVTCVQAGSGCCSCWCWCSPSTAAPAAYRTRGRLISTLQSSYTVCSSKSVKGVSELQFCRMIQGHQPHTPQSNVGELCIQGVERQRVGEGAIFADIRQHRNSGSLYTILTLRLNLVTSEKYTNYFIMNSFIFKKREIRGGGGFFVADKPRITRDSFSCSL